MKIIFGTTNERKVIDLKNTIKRLDLDIEVLDLNDINWDRGEIEETGSTIEENSMIKAKAILNFCKDNINYPIITDDAGLFCEALNGEPGVYTARYADEERSNNPELPKYQCVIKLLDKLKNESNRNAYYKCTVTCITKDKIIQKTEKSNGTIAKEILGELKKPYFYSVFMYNNKPFSSLSNEELISTYRYTALEETLKEIKEEYK